jgi:hypothetical protein
LTSPFNRTNLELARTLVILGRAGEAVQTLQYALTGPLEASSYYTTHSELRALLGSAFEAAGQRDSAIAHYRWTVNAWRAADRVFVARRDSLRARLAALERTAGR